MGFWYSVNTTISNKANIRHIIGTDYTDKFISPHTGGVKFVLNEGNDALELNGSNNIVLINKHAGIKTISNFEPKDFLQLSTILRISLITDEEISISYDYQSYHLKSQCFQSIDINNNYIFIDTSGSNSHIMFQEDFY